MLVLTIANLSLLAFLNYRVGGKALFYPPATFSAIWAFDLFLIWAAGDFFYPMMPKTLFIFLCGAIAFSAGAWISNLFPFQKPVKKAIFSEASDRILNVLLFAIVLGVPFYYRWVAGLVAGRGGAAPFLMASRLAILDETSRDMAYTAFLSLAELSMIVAMIAFYEKERHPKRAILAVVLALFMTALLGAKTGPVGLAVNLICIDTIKRSRFRRKLFLGMALLIITAIGLMEFYVHLGGTNSNASVRESFAAIGDNIVLYASGGMVAFDRVVREPRIVPRDYPFDIVFLRAFKRLGADVNVPSGRAQYVTVGPDSAAQNVYTIYWSYLDFGYIGMMLPIAALGLAATLVYKRALQGNITSIFLYAAILFGILFSPFAEYLSTYLYFISKLCVVCWLVYSFPVRWVQFTTFVKNAVAAKLTKNQRA